jgi:hypothetical protein
MIISIILTTIFIAFAGICKAIADTLKDHFDTSIFKWKNPKFWKPDVSWQYVGYIRFTKYHPDAWHIANSLMIVFFCLAIAVHGACRFGVLPEVVMYGGVFDIAFNLFYNKILKKP